MPDDLDLKDGNFRVLVCENGHITLQALDADTGAVSVVCVMSDQEAIDLALMLLSVADKVRFPSEVFGC